MFACLTLFFSILAMILIAILAIFGTFFWLDSYTMHGEANLVPNVCKMQFEDAVDVFKTR